MIKVQKKPKYLGSEIKLGYVETKKFIGVALTSKETNGIRKLTFYPEYITSKKVSAFKRLSATEYLDVFNKVTLTLMVPSESDSTGLYDGLTDTIIPGVIRTLKEVPAHTPEGIKLAKKHSANKIERKTEEQVKRLIKEARD